MIQPEDIVFVSGHYPADVEYAIKTSINFQAYTARHGYGYFYDYDEPPCKKPHSLHYNRCLSLQKAQQKFPDAKWYVWVDSDVYVNPEQQHVRVEDVIDLTDTTIMYHLFHEKPGWYPVNTGVKFVNSKAIPYEAWAYSVKDTSPYDEFPYEQKCIVELIMPSLPGRCLVHDPWVLNCLTYLYPERLKNALFIHMCGLKEKERNHYVSLHLEFIDGYAASP